MLAKKADFFATLREVRCDEIAAYTVGQAVSLCDGGFEVKLTYSRNGDQQW